MKLYLSFIELNTNVALPFEVSKSTSTILYIKKFNKFK